MTTPTQAGGTANRRVILMRGLPSCGKSWTAKRIATEESGVSFEFDQFFENNDGQPAGETGYHWIRHQLPEAREWQFARVRDAIDKEVSPIVVDDNHRPGPTAKAITAYALSQGYTVEFAEPDSPWWKSIRPLLSNLEANKQELAKWAQKLCRLSAKNHSVPIRSFIARMERWNKDLTVVDLLAWGENQNETTQRKVA